jgi:NapC/NirT cytochrome c family protein
MNRLREWLQPFFFFSNNWISLIGVVLVTTATVFWLFLLPQMLLGEESHPYLGILTAMLLPGCFLAGLALIPVGIALQRRSLLRRGMIPAVLPPLDWANPGVRRLVTLVGLLTCVNIMIAAQASYHAVNYMDSVTFCGQTCHTVMKPEFAAYQNSPHARVECVKCHIGPGASFFVKSKVSGIWQVFAVTFNTYDRPIQTPVANLRPARETCETCHWPQKYGDDRLRVINKFGDDEKNTPSKTVLLLRVGAIHRAHQGEGVHIRYYPADLKRQSIPLVGAPSGIYQSPDFKMQAAAEPPGMREMDCMDCHNRPTHTFEVPERAVDTAMAAGRISAALPFAKKNAVAALKEGKDGADAERRFVSQYPGAPDDARRSAEMVRRIFERNVFPEMKITWGTYPNHVGHTDSPGCFRCHDGNHKAKQGKELSQDCNTCHSLVAMEEPSPKILGDLGVAAQ